MDETRVISNSNTIYTALRETLRYKSYHQQKQYPVTSRGVGKRLAARSSTMVTPGAALRISLAVSFKIHMHKAHKFRRCTNTTGSKHHFDFHSHPQIHINRLTYQDDKYMVRRNNPLSAKNEKENRTILINILLQTKKVLMPADT